MLFPVSSNAASEPRPTNPLFQWTKRAQEAPRAHVGHAKSGVIELIRFGVASAAICSVSIEVGRTTRSQLDFRGEQRDKCDTVMELLLHIVRHHVHPLVPAIGAF